MTKECPNHLATTVPTTPRRLPPPPRLPLTEWLQLEDRCVPALISWDGGGSDNNWSTKENWSGDVVPTAADTVTLNEETSPTSTVDAAFTIAGLIIPDAKFLTTLDLSADLTVGTVTMASGKIQGAGDLIVNTSMDWSGGMISGTVKNQNTSTLTISDEVYLPGTVKNEGIVNVSADTIVHLMGTLENLDGATLELGNNSLLKPFFQSAGEVVNKGTLTVPGDAIVQVDLTNTANGHIQISGELSVTESAVGVPTLTQDGADGDAPQISFLAGGVRRLSVQSFNLHFGDVVGGPNGGQIHIVSGQMAPGVWSWYGFDTSLQDVSINIDSNSTANYSEEQTQPNHNHLQSVALVNHGTFNQDHGLNVDASVIENHGTYRLHGPAPVRVPVAGSSLIWNHPGSMFTAVDTGAGSGVESMIQAKFISEGLLEVQSGNVVQFVAGGEFEGQIQVGFDQGDPTAEVAFLTQVGRVVQPIEWQPGLQYVGPGIVRVAEGAVVTVAAGATISIPGTLIVNHDDSRIEGASELALGLNFKWYGGTLDQVDVLIPQSGFVSITDELLDTGQGTFGLVKQLLNEAELVIQGTGTWSGTGKIEMGTDTQILIDGQFGFGSFLVDTVEDIVVVGGTIGQNIIIRDGGQLTHAQPTFIASVIAPRVENDNGIVHLGGFHFEDGFEQSDGDAILNAGEVAEISDWAQFNGGELIVGGNLTVHQIQLVVSNTTLRLWGGAVIAVHGLRLQNNALLIGGGWIVGPVFNLGRLEIAQDPQGEFGGSALNVTGDFQNDGEILIQPQMANGTSLEALNITGNFTQSSTGVLQLDYSALYGDFATWGIPTALLNVSGTAALGGTLRLTMPGDYEPEVGERLTILTYGVRVDDFDTFEGLELPGPNHFETDLTDPDQYDLIVVAD